MAPKKTADESAPRAPEPAREGALRHIADALHGLQFGVVSVVVQDGVVIQIERTEKRRLRGPQG